MKISKVHIPLRTATVDKRWKYSLRWGYKSPYLLLIAIFGLAGGVVFSNGLARTEPHADVLFTVVAGGAGAMLYMLLWIGVSSTLLKFYQGAPQELCQRSSLCFVFGLLPLVLYFPYLIYRSGLEGETVELPPLDSRYTVILLLFWSLVLLATLLKITLLAKKSSIVEKISSRPAITLMALMASWLVVFFTLDVLKDHYMQVNTINSAVYRESMLNIFDERGLLYSNMIISDGGSVLAIHSNLIMFLISPIFRMWPDYRWLLFISDLALVLAAIPVYLIARRHFATGISLLLTAMYLFHPILTAQPGRSDFSELRFMPIIFLLAFYFFETKRFWFFLCASALLLSIREDLGLFVFFIGIFALIQRRSLKWILTPLLMGLSWVAAMIFFLIPHFSPTGEATRLSVRYSVLGESSSEIIKTLLFKPWVAIKAAFSTPSHIGAIYGLFISFGFGVPLLTGAVIMALPAASELLFQQTTTLVTFMALLSLPTLMIAVIYGMKRLDRIGQYYGYAIGRTATVAGVFIFFLALTPFHTWFNPGMYQPRYNYDAAREAFSMVPDDAKVELPEFMLAYAKPEQTLFGFHQATYQLEQQSRFYVQADYVIVDLHIPARTGDNRYYSGLIETTKYVKNSPDFNKVFGSDDIELYVRRGFQPVSPEA